MVPKKNKSGEITSVVSCKCLIVRVKVKVKTKFFCGKFLKFLKLFGKNNKRKNVRVCVAVVLIMVCVVGLFCGAGW